MSKEKLYDALRGQIMTMELEPGVDLDEASLSQEFGLSRTPLREVFMQLAGEGYVELRKNKGARVSDFGPKTLRNFFLTAPMIYSATTRLASQNAKPQQLIALKEAQAAFRNALEGGSTQARALSNNRFHAVIGEMADNAYLLPSLNRLLIDHARISMTFYKPQNVQMAATTALACEQHEEMIRAIETGDGDAAQELAIAHWNLSRHQIEKFVTPSALDVPFGDLETA